MKKLFVFLLVPIMASLLALGAFAADISPAIAILRSKMSMKKTCVGQNALVFMRSDFEDLIGASVDEITVVSTPDSAAGSLTLNGEPVEAGDVIRFEDAPTLLFAPTDDFCGTGGATAVFGIGGYEYDCVIYASRSLNFAPAAEGCAVSCIAGVSVYSELTSSDPENDEVTYKIVDYARHGTVRLDSRTGAFSYTPNAAHIGGDSFTFAVTDSFGNVSAPAKVEVRTKMNTSGTVYDDMACSAAHIAAVKMAENNVIAGEKIGDKQYFYPEKEVSRIEFLIMAMDAMDIKKTDAPILDTGFADDGMLTSYEKKYVATAANIGMITGVDTDAGMCFEPNRTITLGEAATIMARISSYFELGISASVPASTYSGGVVDAEGMTAMRTLGIIPDGEPSDAVTREMTASSLWALMNAK